MNAAKAMKGILCVACCLVGSDALADQRPIVKGEPTECTAAVTFRFANEGASGPIHMGFKNQEDVQLLVKRVNETVPAGVTVVRKRLAASENRGRVEYTIEGAWEVTVPKGWDRETCDIRFRFPEAESIGLRNHVSAWPEPEIRLELKVYESRSTLEQERDAARAAKDHEREQARNQHAGKIGVFLTVVAAGVVALLVWIFRR